MWYKFVHSEDITIEGDRVLWHIRHIEFEPAGSAVAPNPICCWVYFCIFVSLSKYKIKQAFLNKEARDWCEFSPSSRRERCLQYIREQRSVRILLIWNSSSRNSWIWCTTQVLSAFFNTCQIYGCFSCILHFRGRHQCRVVRSCFIYELVTSTKFKVLNLQNSKCKYPPMPSEFQFKEPPLALGIPKSRPSWCMDIFWNCPIYFSSCRMSP